jgi:hypothetical protein
VRKHVGVDEDHDVTGGVSRARVPGGCRPAAFGDDDDLLRRLVGGRDRAEACGERGGRSSRG